VVALGLLIGYGLSNLLAAAVGGIAGENLPASWVGLASGAVFLLFAALSARRLGSAPEVAMAEGPAVTGPSGGAVGAGVSITVVTAVSGIASVIFVGELGDKTQLATAALAANGPAAATWIGATAGVTSAGLLGAAVGSRLARRLSPRTIIAVSTALFAAFGVVILIGAVVAADW